MQTDNNLTIPVFQVRHDSAIVYEYWAGARKAHFRHEEFLEKARKQSYSGQVSAGAKKNIRRAVDLLLQASPRRIIYNTVSSSYHHFQLGFWTLSVSDRKIQPDKIVMAKCMRPFCNWLQKRNIVYIWKAELQERRQIHYHITTNQFIHFGEIRKQWNKLQRKAGFLKGYAERHGHYNPNSVDVHTVVNLKDIEAYLVKYITKQQGREFCHSGFPSVVVPDLIDGKVWGCSRCLTERRFETELDSSIWSEALKHKLKYLDNCTIVKAPGAKLLGRADSIKYQIFLKSIN